MTAAAPRGAVPIAARAIAIAAPAVAAAIGLALPHSVLWGGLAWLGFLLAALAGWGHAVERATRAEVDLGLRLAWGTGAILGASGPLLALGVLDRSALLVLLALGYAAYAWRHATRAEPALIAIGREVRALGRDPRAAILWAVLIAIVAVNVLRAVARLQGNPLDDDIAYTPFVKRLLDTGDLEEPFNFRRLSALGGQTILQGLGAARGTFANLYLVDHGVCQLVALALLGGLLRRARPLDPFVAGLVLLVTLLLPDASINTGSYWSGVVLFLGLYRTAAVLDELPRLGFAVLGGLAAATCTLRQPYVPVAVFFAVMVLLLRLRRPLAASLRADRAAWRDTIVAGAIVLVPFLVALWRSNQTFLYPLQLGTANPHVPTTPLVWSAWQELGFFLRVALDPNPIRVMVPLLPVVLLCRDHRRGAPLVALTMASAIGFVLLVHAFTLSDARNLWRYAFGYMTVLALVIAIETTARGVAAGDRDGDAPVTTSTAARVIVLACLLAQLAYTGRSTIGNYQGLAAELTAATRGARDEAVPALYRRLQASVPAGAPLVVLVDDAAHLDYARNRIVHLDTPGLASYRPGMPMFAGAEAKAAYLRGHGLRYLAFVRGDHSRFFYRRDHWLDRVLRDTELWRIIGAYQVDTADSFAELATRYPVLFEEQGLVVLDLGAAR